MNCSFYFLIVMIAFHMPIISMDIGPSLKKLTQELTNLSQALGGKSSKPHKKPTEPLPGQTKPIQLLWGLNPRSYVMINGKETTLLSPKDVIIAELTIQYEGTFESLVDNLKNENLNNRLRANITNLSIKRTYQNDTGLTNTEWNGLIELTKESEDLLATICNKYNYTISFISAPQFLGTTMLTPGEAPQTSAQFPERTIDNLRAKYNTKEELILGS